jgi:hypothetical protein
MTTHICIAETRASAEVPLKLTLLSIAAHNSDVVIHLCYPPADERFANWLERVPQVRLTTNPIRGASGWNIKPYALMDLLDEGINEAVWIDSDVIVTGEIRPKFARLGPDTLVVTEEGLSGLQDPDALRARAWRFKVGRTLPFAANTGVLRVCREHLPLLQAWRGLLESSEYRAAQHLPWNQRPPHMYGDQDVLTALLTSEAFAQIPVHFLRRGRDVIQYYGPFGYTLGERVRTIVRGMPTFIHAQVGKPWEAKATDAANAREWFGQVYLELSPHTLAARHYRHLLDADAPWMEPRHPLSRALRAGGLYYPPLVGLPLAVVADAFRVFKGAVRTLTALRAATNTSL